MLSNFLTHPHHKPIVIDNMIQGLVSIILVATQFILACPLVLCSGPDGHVQVEIAHQVCRNHVFHSKQVCCESIAAESKAIDQTHAALKPQPCTDTPIQLPQWATNKSSGDCNELRLTRAAFVSPILVSIHCRVLVWRQHDAIYCSDAQLYALRTVILTV